MLKHLQDRRGADPSLLERGFTLVELLVVIVILGILAAVVVFAVGGSTKDAATNACLAERSTVESAIEAFKAETGNYPGAWQEMISGVTIDGQLKGKLLRHSPKYWDLAGTDGSIQRSPGNDPLATECNVNT